MRYLPPLLVLTLLAGPAAQAQYLAFPVPATVSDSVQSPAGTLALANGPWTPASGTPLRSVDGAVSQTAYRLEGTRLTTSQLMAPLRDALIAQGYATLFECADAACGGFDFRYDLPLLPEPVMHVDLGDYRYFAGTKGIGLAVMLVVSRSANAGFVQVSVVGQSAAVAAPTLSTTSDPIALPAPAAIIAPATPITGDIGARLETGGAIALDDLVFPSGAATLAPGEYASLTALAGYLVANPARRVALVGHTDASGALDANVALSRRRAESVRRVLIERFNIAAAQVQADGVGYLSPRASNLTDQGRATNRRVEVMLVNTE